SPKGGERSDRRGDGHPTHDHPQPTPSVAVGGGRHVRLHRHPPRRSIRRPPCDLGGPSMTADALRDRIAAAWSDHETGTLHPEGYVPCACGQRFSSPQALARHRASVILEVLADANPTDLGLETSGVWYCRRHSGIANEDDHRGLCPW